MASETLAMIGVTAPDGRPSLVLLSDRANLATFDQGAAEDLQDHTCGVLRGPGAA